MPLHPNFFPLVSWENLSGDEVCNQIMYEKPDLSQFTCIGDKIFFQRSDSDYSYNQMTEHYGARQGCHHFIYNKQEYDDQSQKAFAQVLEEEVGKLSQDEIQFIYELTISDDFGSMIAIFPFNSGLYIIDIL